MKLSIHVVAVKTAWRMIENEVEDEGDAILDTDEVDPIFLSEDIEVSSVT